MAAASKPPRGRAPVEGLGAVAAQGMEGIGCKRNSDLPAGVGSGSWSPSPPWRDPGLTASRVELTGAHGQITMEESQSRIALYEGLDKDWEARSWIGATT